MKIQLQTSSGALVHSSELAPMNGAPKVVLWGTRCFALAEQLETKGAKCRYGEKNNGADLLIADLHPNAGLLIYREAFVYELTDDIGARARPTSGFSAVVSENEADEPGAIGDETA